MHTEHLQNVGVRRVITGWLIAIAITSLVLLALMGLYPIAEPEQVSSAWALIAVLIGFWAGGFFVGFRAIEAPILHGIGIAITSLVAWVLVNLIASLAIPAARWEGLTPALAVGLVLAQVIAAVLGALIGYNIALRGKPGLREHEPLDQGGS